jgi:hypothetical protein
MYLFAEPPRCHDEGNSNVEVVVTHAVEDIDRWLQGKEGRAAAIESGTGSNVTDYVAADGSNNVAITADVADVAAIKSMLESPSPEVLAAMQNHGVVPPFTAYIQK